MKVDVFAAHKMELQCQYREAYTSKHVSWLAVAVGGKVGGRL